HDVRDDHAHLAADAVVAVGHRGHEAFVLADDQAVVAILGDRGEQAGLRGARVGEQILHARVLERLEEQHPAGAGVRLAHDLVGLAARRWRPGRSVGPPPPTQYTSRTTLGSPSAGQPSAAARRRTTAPIQMTTVVTPIRRVDTAATVGSISVRI